MILNSFAQNNQGPASDLTRIHLISTDIPVGQFIFRLYNKNVSYYWSYVRRIRLVSGFSAQVMPMVSPSWPVNTSVRVFLEIISHIYLRLKMITGCDKTWMRVRLEVKSIVWIGSSRHIEMDFLVKLRLYIHWSLFIWAQWTIFQYWFR